MALSALIGMAVLLVLTAGGCARLAALRRRVQETRLALKGQLHHRRDRIPSWIETLRRSAPSSREWLEGVTQAQERAAAATRIPARAEAENRLTEALHALLAAAAANPGQEDSSDLRRLQEELTEIENQLLAAGRRYNDQVMALNVTISRFPWRLVARPAGFRPIEYFVLDEPPRPEAPRQG